MRILITGGSGLVGGRLAHYFSQTGCEVTIGGRQIIGPVAWLPSAKTLQVNWGELQSLQLACQGMDVVIHAAGMNAQDCVLDPIEALAFNGVATASLLNAAVNAGVQQFIYISTAHVYASPLAGVISEQSCPSNIHPYATSHLAGESAVLYAQQQGRINGAVLRLSNAFGAPLHRAVNCWMLLVNDLCRQAVTNRRLTLRTAGLQRRDFVTLHDVSRAVEHIIKVPGLGKGGAIFNIGGEWSPRVIDLVEIIQQRCLTMLGFLPEIVVPSARNEEQTQELDFRIDKLKKAGFNLCRDIEREIDATLLICNDFFGGV